MAFILPRKYLLTPQEKIDQQIRSLTPWVMRVQKVPFRRARQILTEGGSDMRSRWHAHRMYTLRHDRKPRVGKP